MTRRKPHNMRARMERAAGALLRQHHACIVIDARHAHRIYERVSAWGIPQRAIA